MHFQQQWTWDVVNIIAYNNMIINLRLPTSVYLVTGFVQPIHFNAVPTKQGAVRFREHLSKSLKENGNYSLWFSIETIDFCMLPSLNDIVFISKTISVYDGRKPFQNSQQIIFALHRPTLFGQCTNGIRKLAGKLGNDGRTT